MELFKKNMKNNELTFQHVVIFFLALISNIGEREQQRTQLDNEIIKTSSHSRNNSIYTSNVTVGHGAIIYLVRFVN